MEENEQYVRPLAHFENAVLKSVLFLEGGAFPANIARDLSGKMGRNVSLAQVFVALERLEDKQLVSSKNEIPASPTRGGRRRRVFKIEASGRWALSITAAAFGADPFGGHHGAKALKEDPSPA